MKNLKVRIGVIFIFSVAILIIIAASASAMVQSSAPALAPLSKTIENKVFVVKAKNPYPANEFAFSDQRGKKISLSQLRGKTVVLTFMDPHCTDICLLVSHEFIKASRELGSNNKNVVFLAINVNSQYNKVSDVLKFSKQHGLNKLSNWHFLTGTPTALKAMWKDYGIAVVPGKDGDIKHASVIYFIDPEGNVKFRGHPYYDKTALGVWAKAICYYAQKSF